MVCNSGKLGELRFFASDFSMQVSEENIRLERAKGGGPLYDIGIYCINAARYSVAATSIMVAAAPLERHVNPYQAMVGAWKWKVADQTKQWVILLRPEHAGVGNAQGARGQDVVGAEVPGRRIGEVRGVEARITAVR